MSETKQGTIHVQTENIFPIIKKFLYSDHEIFLRELVSNAVDACQKLKTMSAAGDYKGDLDAFKVDISINKDAKTITISDNGIGMTADEVEKYLNQVAFSGAREFLDKYKGVTDSASIIGHFGLGFYSAFMVSKQVEVITKSFTENSQAVRWTCDGSPQYTLQNSDKTSRGTDIILHIADDSEEFLEPSRLKSILEKYGKFLPIEVFFDNQKINNTTPAWIKKPVDLNADDYQSFYRELYPMVFDDPLFHIHLNVDYPFNLTGILYFPKIKAGVEPQRNKIQLYSQQVFITDSVEGIVPEFLMLMHGVLDSPDIPLNVSRSYLQSDGNVKKISSHITKKVADKLHEMFKNDRADFEKKWDDIKIFIEYGTLTDEKFAERAQQFALFKNVDGKYYTLDEYKNHVAGTQTNKDNKISFLYTHNPDEHYTYMMPVRERGYDVLILDTPLTSHYIMKLEQMHPDLHFARIDADSIDKLIDKGISSVSKLTEDQKKELLPLFEKCITKEKFTLQWEDLSETDPPVIITQSEFMRRMNEMNAMGNRGFSGDLPEFYGLTLNANHPLVTKIMLQTDNDKQEQMARQAIDLALLGKNLLRGEALAGFIQRSISLID
ncbi:MAG: molecular chaperone HtpG [Candidatus Competibacteraceae bacterium]|nr:molecular chaperone HtpG [Candidatus Competibacteraceae bacterium]